MRVEYINPFVEAANEVLSEVLNCNIKRGKLYLKSSAMPMKGVAAILGLAGSVQGRIIFDMSKDTALKIASIMNGEELTIIDDLVRATVTELANMITGNAVTKLSALGFVFDLTPPSLLMGDNMEISDDEKVEALIVPLDMDVGSIEINVALKS